MRWLVLLSFVSLPRWESPPAGAEEEEEEGARLCLSRALFGTTWRWAQRWRRAAPSPAAAGGASQTPSGVRVKERLEVIAAPAGLPSTAAALWFNSPRGGDDTASLGSLCQCSRTS